MLYNCFIAGGFVVPVLNVAAGAVGGALHLGGGGDLDADLDLDADVDLDEERAALLKADALPHGEDAQLSAALELLGK